MIQNIFDMSTTCNSADFVNGNLQVQDAASAVYNKIMPSAEAKEPSEARQHLHRAGDAAEDAGRDLKTSAYELKEAVSDSARGYGRAATGRY